jgi:methylated-DNA-[protein]-cysteine S-methyltransferase
LQLAEYFAGKRRVFSLPLAPRGTPFQRSVWQALRQIPYGETVSYGELARRLGSTSGARAVGLANGANPLPIIVPCHRVIGADGSLTGFGGGLTIKRALLALEGAACVRDLFSAADICGATGDTRAARARGS